jgi:outer membrane protein insertion porin family
MNLRAGTERSDFSVSLVEPWFMDQQLALGGELFYRESSYFSDNFDQTNIGGLISLRKPLGPRSSIKGEYRLENINIDSDINNNSFFTPAGIPDGNNSQFAEDRIGGDYLRSAIGVNYIYDSRDSVIQARSGHKVDLGMVLAGLGGDVETFTLSAQGVKYWNLKWDTILSLNGELAVVDTFGDDVPIFERMYLGGGRTLRGFEFRNVGPRDLGYTNDVFGGNSLGYATLEYSVPVIESVRAVVFSDSGFVNADSWDLNPGDIYSDVGLGIRLKLPISPLPLALDYAIPVVTPSGPTGDEADTGGQFQFSVSSQF